MCDGTNNSANGRLPNDRSGISWADYGRVEVLAAPENEMVQRIRPHNAEPSLYRWFPA
ncbi:MAG: hypothetical protein HQ518_15590 [Rhodopirellula sp.]|nr:hypothetical protein [Rhodopirellula sp.]